MAGFWENDAIVAPQQGSSTSRGGVFIPDEGAIADEARDARADARGEVQTGIAVRGEQRQISQDEASAYDTVRQRYEAQLAVKEYRVILPLLMSGLQTPNDPTGDNTLLYAYAKVMDPGSVVREAEGEMAASGASFWDQKVNDARKLYGVEGVGSLPPDVRRRLRRDMNQKAAELGRSYLLQRQRWGEEAQAQGLDPMRVVGPHDSEPFRERYYQTMERLGIDVPNPNEPAGQAGAAPETAQGEPFPGVVGQDGKPLPASGGYGLDTATGEWGLYGVGSGVGGAPDDGRIDGNDPAYQQFAAGVGDIAQTAGDFIGIAGNPLNQTINWLTGSNLSTDLGETLRTDVLGLPHGDPTIESINRFVAGSFLPAAGAAKAAQAFAPGVTRASLAQLGASPIRDAFAGGGAGAASEGVKAMGGGPVAQTIAMLAGGGAGAAVGNKVSPAAVDAALSAPAARAATETPAQRYADAQKFGLDISVGDARPMGSRVLERSLDAQPASAGVMDAARQKLAGQIDTAVESVADSFGPATSFREMGVAAQTGARRWMDKFSETTGKLYDAIPIKPETTANLDGTRTALRDLTETFASNPQLRSATQNTKLMQYRQALEKGGLSWEDLKAFRTDIGEQMGEALLTDGARKGQLKRLYAALSTDMEETARAQGPRALAAFRRANDTFAAGQTRIEGAIRSLIGNADDRSPEAAAQFLQRIAREGKGGADLKALAEVRRTLNADEWGQVSNGFIRLMGQPANSAGREFSPQTFVRVYSDMAPEAKNLLFGGPNKALRQNLDEFVSVIDDMAANDATRNVSRTALGLGGVMSSGLGAAAGAQVGGLPGALLGVVLTNAAQYGAAKLWTNPGFVRWATGYSKMMRSAANNNGLVNPKSHEGQMQALGRLAASNAIISGEARDLQQQLAAQFSQGPTRLAAQGEDSRTSDSTGTTGGTR